MREPFSPVTDRWPLYTTPDEEAPEDEVIRLITSLIYALKPRIVIETGTANGITARAIGLELKKWDGILHTFEVDSNKVKTAKYNTQNLPVHVYDQQARAVNPRNYGPVDFLFIDAVLEERHLEFQHWAPALRGGGIAFLHDTMKFDPPRSQVKALEEMGYPQIWLPTPRGVTLIQKGFPNE